MKTKIQWALSITAIVLGVTLALLTPAQGQIMGPGGGGALVGAGGFSGGTVSSPILAPQSATNTSAPGYAYAGLPTTGWGYSTGTIYAINQGTRIFYASTTGSAWDVPLLQLDGTQTTPTYAFISAPNTGMWRASSGNLAFSVAGNLSLTVSSTFIVVNNSISLDAARAAVLAISSRINTPLHTPTTSAEACVVGDWSSDAGFVYVCTATNTWKRATLVAF